MSLLPMSSIVFIDSNIPDYSHLAKGIVPGAEVIILNGEQDGIKQITETLKFYTSPSIHIVSHGSPGCLYLGNTRLSLDTLDKYTKDIKTWFTPEGERQEPKLFIYGCNVAAGDAGAEFVAKLSNFTGVEIAASTTLTGNKAKGDNWELDYQTTKASSQKNPLAFTPEIDAPPS